MLGGEEGVLELIAEAADEAQAAGEPLTVLNGIVGAAGLRATMATLQAGATLALANKESLVAGGELVIAAARAERRRHHPGRQRAQRPVPVRHGRPRRRRPARTTGCCSRPPRVCWTRRSCS